jgi:hypothetical protein
MAMHVAANVALRQRRIETCWACDYFIDDSLVKLISLRRWHSSVFRWFKAGLRPSAPLLGWHFG